MQGSEIPWATQQNEIDQLWSKALAQDGFDEATRKLLGIAQDGSAEIYLRWRAVDKLAEVRATQMTDTVKALADSLSWRNDRERLLANGATAAYHMLRYHRERDPQRQYELLIDSLKRGKGAANEWAADELVRRNYRQAFTIIAAVVRRRKSGERAESYIRLCKLKFEVMSAEDRKAALESVIAGDHPGLDDLCAMRFDERRQMQSWARTQLQDLYGVEYTPVAQEAEAVRSSAGSRWTYLVVGLGAGLTVGAAGAWLLLRRRSGG